MYHIIYSHTYKKRARKIVRSGICPVEKIAFIIDLLHSGIPIPKVYYNHKLQGKYDGMYELHIRPNLLLIYEKDESTKIITLISLGSHPELFG